MPYRTPPPRHTEVSRPDHKVRPWLALVALLFVASVMLGVIAVLDLAGDSFIVGLAAVGSGAAAMNLLFGNVLGGVGAAPCPSCGAALHGLDCRARFEGILCRQCGQFVEGKGGRVWLTDEHAIADTPLFGAALPKRFRWPAGCVVCGEPVTQHLPIHIRKRDVAETAVNTAIGMAMASVVGFGVIADSGTVVALAVPHCGKHDDGASLALGGPTEFLILFRSYAYQRMFCRENKVSVLESPATGRSRASRRAR
ncbi:hypothetical protein [Polyangium sp. y55x31]|uniref:hypothetical protein n=1 Tax=Polyangium sp. y55x31 TaxID=3042688 RepID=UPI002482F587|nr:hypothetical protein [Polyangium sp. y55x31]MDI1480296.1 hypothetical protein [Polyangium sp. y55x31]